MQPYSIASRLAQGAFWGALAVALAFAFLPDSEAPSLLPWDKGQHALAFYVLTVLATAAFPHRNLLTIAVCLSGVGALIEVVQAIPALHRDSDAWDWVADSAAILCALASVVVGSWRSGVGRLDRVEQGSPAAREGLEDRARPIFCPIPYPARETAPEPLPVSGQIQPLASRA